MSVLESLGKEINGIDPTTLEEPSNEMPEEGWQKIGVLSEEARRIFGLRIQLCQQLEGKRACKCGEGCQSRPFCLDIRILKNKIRILESLFHLEIDEQFPDLGNKDPKRVGIFSGWEIAYREKDSGIVIIIEV